MLKPAKNQTDAFLNNLGYDLLEENRQALSLAGIKPGTTVLEIAAGSGRMTGVLSEAGHIVYTGDINCSAFLKLRGRIGDLCGARITFIPFDAVKMPFPNGIFKTVVCANALHEIQSPIEVIGEMMRVCSNDGRLIITDFNDNGFEVIEQVHNQIHGSRHNRGSITACEISRELRSHFPVVKYQSLALNNVWIAERGAHAT